MGGRNKFQDITHNLRKFIRFTYLKELVLNPSKLPFTAFVIIVAELILNILIVEKVPYTEIDWKAYMQECEGFLNGTLDYSKLRGDTGPLVYPAGIYLLQLYFVLRIYIKTNKVPPYVLLITILTSYRIHSIHVLRLFNDPIAVLFLYISLNYFLESKWSLGSIFYSLGVSIKMNILLYAPALFFFYLINLGLKETVKQIFLCGIIQIFLGLPFLLVAPVSYLRGSFDLGRVFNHTWTVNYRFLDVKIFENPYFHLTLFSIHILLLIIFLPMCVKYFKSYCRLEYVQKQVQPQIDAKNIETKKRFRGKKDNKIKLQENNEEKLTKDQEQFLNSFQTILQKASNKNGKKKKVLNEQDDDVHYSINFDVISQLFILPMFLINFIGIVCARSLHYQFYSWYFHSLPYLLWSTNISVVVRFLILALIEFCWNTYPSTNFTSVMLHICHVTILYNIYKKTSAELNMVSKMN
ncbi:unnamed protein product [Parnassius mnemosyne]|uniref:dolichyl-P-Man:Man5GlcNAc2-PP-dolichol alpha-1,3-mannosyltransferase n=1 Tax=Parnassius mnemosyne TaxID=213953 RepID=A0AAV1LYL7_9NEOP